jgi:hypothetical protein
MRVDFNIWQGMLDANDNGGKSALKKCNNFIEKWLFHPIALPKIQQISTQEISADFSQKYPESIPILKH